MEKTVYAYLNDMDNQPDSYDIDKVAECELASWKREFERRRRMDRRRHVGKYASAVAVLAFVLAMGIFHNQVYAQIHILTYSIQELLGIDKSLDSYAAVVGKSVSRDGITVTLNDVIILDGNSLLISYTTTTSKRIETPEQEAEYVSGMGISAISVNGRHMTAALRGESEKRDDYNIVSLDELIFEEINLTEKMDIKLEFCAEDKKIGSLEFTASGLELLQDTGRISVDSECQFLNGQNIHFTVLSTNPVKQRIYFETSPEGVDYDMKLRGQDDLGNKVEFSYAHCSGGKGWFELEEDYYISRKAQSLSLTLYAVKLPEKSGEISGEYREVDEPFIIPLR